MNDREKHKAGKGSNCTSISRTALETGAEFGLVATLLRGRDELPLQPHLLSCSALGSDTPLDASPAAWLAEATYYHVELGERVRSGGKATFATSMKSTLAFQRKLLGAVQKTGNTKGLEAASLAISFEEAAGVLSFEPGQARFARRLVDLAATTTDRCVLNDRYREHTGLVSDAATHACRSFPDAAHDLVRLGRLSSKDPRALLAHNASESCDFQSAKEFLTHLKSNLWSEIPKVANVDDASFSRAAIARDLAGLPGRGTPTRTQLDLDSRDRDFMQVVSRVAERAAMNRHSAAGPAQAEAVSSLLITSASAVGRANTYDQRARRAERKLGNAPRKRDGEPVLN